MSNIHKDFIMKTLKSISHKYNIRQVYEDFVMCCAYAISNSCNYKNNIEKEYLKIAKKYTREEMYEFSKMMAHLQVECVKKDNFDILGSIYEEIGMNEKNRGQFFTPKDVCDFMTKISISAEESKRIINDKGYISINDSACGSGRTLFSSIKYLEENNVDMKDIYVEGDDISLFCCCMTYVTLSLKGVSGIVKHQDTLSKECWNTFYTPAFMYNIELQEKMKKNKEMEYE